MDTGLSSQVDDGTPAGDAAKNELTAIMSDPKHQMYEGYRRRDPAVLKHIDDTYRRAYPALTPHEKLQASGEQPSLSQDEREAAEDARELEQLRDDWERDGGGYEAGLAEAKEMALVLHNADPALYLEASRRLGDAMGLKLLRMLRQRVNL